MIWKIIIKNIQRSDLRRNAQIIVCQDLTSDTHKLLFKKNKRELFKTKDLHWIDYKITQSVKVRINYQAN